MGERRVTGAWVNSCVKLQRKLLLNNSKYWWRLIYTSPGTHVESWWHMSGIWSWCCLSWSVIDLGTGETGARPTLSGVHNSADRRLADCSTAPLQACHHANLLVSCVLNFCLSLLILGCAKSVRWSWFTWKYIYFVTYLQLDFIAIMITTRSVV